MEDDCNGTGVYFLLNICGCYYCSKNKINVMELTAENVNKILMDCLFTDNEDRSNYIEAEGVRLKVGLHPQRLEKHREEIEDMLNQLPKEFKKDSGGGWSFLNACMTAEGKQWGEHSNIDELLCLGNAIGKVHMQFPREMWSIFPGGMPYFSVG